MLLSGWQLIETTYWLAIKSYKLYMWFGIGVGVYLVLRKIPLLHKNAEWFETQTHEWLHTIVALLFGQKIHAVNAGEKEGVMYHSGRFSRNIFISLAPYCLPLYTYAFCLLRLLSDRQTLYIFDLLIGLTLAFHLSVFLKQAKPYQTDIKEFGYLTSYTFIAAFLFFNITIVLLTVKTGLDDAFIYQFEQYWKNILSVWRHLWG
jgi:hypothetical protein